MEPIDTSRNRPINHTLLNNFQKTTMHKFSSQKIDQIERLIDEFLESGTVTQRKQAHPTASTEDIPFPEEQRLKELVLHRMFVKKKDFEFLVEPAGTRKVIRPLHGNSFGKGRISAQEVYPQEANETHKFTEFVESEIPKVSLP
jgi:2-hydroxy-3-keto-5-methylthiopentenyl-1-phosphate phosphatase